ncbi:uncharacterized protein [Amphiura filiformis]|uniref:uncharacterized protein n=1 Tax=Amphiura filiformis TaxID=82378 RepID=UPI003B22031D
MTRIYLRVLVITAAVVHVVGYNIRTVKDFGQQNLTTDANSGLVTEKVTQVSSLHSGDPTTTKETTYATVPLEEDERAASSSYGRHFICSIPNNIADSVRLVITTEMTHRVKVTLWDAYRNSPVNTHVTQNENA